MNLRDKLIETRRSLQAQAAELEKEFSTKVGEDLFLTIEPDGHVTIELPKKKTTLTDDECGKLRKWLIRLFKDENAPETTPSKDPEAVVK